MQYYKEERVAVIKPTSNEYWSTGFGDWKRNLATNMSKVTNMIEAAGTCQRNIYLKLKSLSNVTLHTVSGGVRLWLRMFVGKKRLRLLRCLDVPIMVEYVLLALTLRLLFVIQPEISPGQSPSWLRERSVSAIDKDMYINDGQMSGSR